MSKPPKKGSKKKKEVSMTTETNGNQTEMFELQNMHSADGSSDPQTGNLAPKDPQDADSNPKKNSKAPRYKTVWIPRWITKASGEVIEKHREISKSVVSESLTEMKAELYRFKLRASEVRSHINFNDLYQFQLANLEASITFKDDLIGEALKLDFPPLSDKLDHLSQLELQITDAIFESFRYVNIFWDQYWEAVRYPQRNYDKVKEGDHFGKNIFLHFVDSYNTFDKVYGELKNVMNNKMVELQRTLDKIHQNIIQPDRIKTQPVHEQFEILHFSCMEFEFILRKMERVISMADPRFAISDNDLPGENK